MRMHMTEQSRFALCVRVCVCGCLSLSQTLPLSQPLPSLASLPVTHDNNVPAFHMPCQQDGGVLATVGEDANLCIFTPKA